MRYLITTFGLLACIFPHLLMGQQIGIPGALERKYVNEFLKIGAGARGFGMGNAQTAIVNDVTAAYWNPAGLASADAVLYPEVSLMHAAYFANVAAFNYVGFAMPINESGTRRFGASLIRLGIDDIPNTLKLVSPNGTINYDQIQPFSTTDLAVLLSYAMRPENMPQWSFGGNLKIVYRSIGRFANAWGFGLDLSVRYATDRFFAGATLLDASTTINAWTFNTETFGQDFIRTGNILPENSIEVAKPTVRIGVGYELDLGDRLSLLTALDGDVIFESRSNAFLSDSAFDVTVDPRLGIELAYKNSQMRKVAFLRGGVYNLQQDRNTLGEEIFGLFPTVGAGIAIQNFQIDYALANIGNLSERLHSHVVSLKFHLQ